MLPPLLQCFKRNPDERPSARALLKHRFLREVDDPRMYRPSTQASTRPYSAFAEPFSEGRGTTGSKAGSEVPLDLEDSADLVAMGAAAAAGSASTGSTLPADIVMVETVGGGDASGTALSAGSGRGSTTNSRRTGTNPGGVPHGIARGNGSGGSGSGSGCTGGSFVVGLGRARHGRRRGDGDVSEGHTAGTSGARPGSGSAGRRRDSAKSHGRGVGAGSGLRPPSGAGRSRGTTGGTNASPGPAHELGGVTTAAQARRQHRSSITSHAGGWDSVKTLPPPDMPTWARDSSDSFAALALEGAAHEASKAAGAATAGAGEGADRRPVSRGSHRQSRSLGLVTIGDEFGAARSEGAMATPGRRPRRRSSNGSKDGEPGAGGGGARGLSPQPSSVSTASTCGDGDGEEAGSAQSRRRLALPSPSPSPTLPLRAPVRTHSPVLTATGDGGAGSRGSRRRLVLRGDLRGDALDESLDEEGNPHSSRGRLGPAARHGPVNGRRSAAGVRRDGGLVARLGADLFASELL